MEENKYFAFISYSRKDLGVTKQIKNNIESITGKKCWMRIWKELKVENNSLML